MASSEVENMRPNIRVEIQNNLAEAMDVDDDNEEGEILDDTETEIKMGDTSSENIQFTNNLLPKSKAIFTTGINIFDKEEQEKLHERAKRFALKPDEINNFTDADLQQLYHTLGITGDNESNVRFEAVHILGIDDMTTEDILNYFSKYAPSAIEFIQDGNCNVIWTDNISAARAIYYTSKVVRGMPVRAALPKHFDLLDDSIESGEDNILRNSNREVALKEDEDIVKINNKVDYKNSVDINEITIPIPPGYWRLGNKHPKSKCILLKYAFKTDKQPYKTESFSKYYKKLSSSRGIISDSKKNEFRSIFERNRELNNDKNPWGTLARNWDEDAKYREREPIAPAEEPTLTIKNPSILVRLGKKTKPIEDEVKVDQTSDDEQNKKKSKIPRMRMYADEEEQKMKRKKLLKTLQKQSEKLEESVDRNDLRSILGITNKKQPQEKVLDDKNEQIDLGLRLKNRNKKMVFAVDRDTDEIENCIKSEDHRADIREFLDRRRAESPKRRHGRTKNRSRSPHYHNRRSPTRKQVQEHRHHRHRSPLRRSPHRTLHSDKMHSDHVHTRINRRRRSYEESDDEFSSKPKSKVAVVIKTQKKPSVASTIWSRVKKPTNSDSESSDSESSESSSESSTSNGTSESEEEIQIKPRSVRPIDRPGFNQHIKSRLTRNIDHRSPLKIEIANDIV